MNPRSRNKLIAFSSGTLAVSFVLVALAGGPISNWTGRAEAKPTEPAPEPVRTYTFDDLFPEVRSVAYSPDGKYLAAGLGEGVRIWDTTTNKEVLKLKVGRVHSVAYSPDGKYLAAGADSGQVWVWEVPAGKELHSLKGHTKSVFSVAFAPDGKRLASAGDTTVRLWDLESGKEAEQFKTEVPTGKKFAPWVHSVAFSRDGKWLASGNGDGTVDLREAKTGKRVHRIAVHTQAVLGLAFDPDSRHLATGTGILRTGEVKLWDVATGKESQALDGHTGYVTCVAFSRDGTRLASSSVDGTVIVWDLKTAKAVLSLPHTSYAQTAAFAPDGEHLASGGLAAKVNVWKVAK